LARIKPEEDVPVQPRRSNATSVHGSGSTDASTTAAVVALVAASNRGESDVDSLDEIRVPEPERRSDRPGSPSNGGGRRGN